MNPYRYKTTLTKQSQTSPNDVLTKKVFLVQTDTTVGFLSQNNQQLSDIKQRPSDKPFVQVCASLKVLKTLVRVPSLHKNRVRRGKKETFVYSNNKAIRVVKEKSHADFIKPFKWFYSTSANEKALSYDKEFANVKSDIIIENSKGLFEGESSSIYKLSQNKIKRLR